jgi:hypothetical protein
LISSSVVPLSPGVATVVFFTSLIWIFFTICSKTMTDWASFDSEVRKQVITSLVFHFLVLGSSAVTVGVLVRIEQDRLVRLSTGYPAADVTPVGGGFQRKE